MMHKAGRCAVSAREFTHIAKVAMLDIGYLRELASGADAQTRCALARQLAGFLTDGAEDPVERSHVLPIALQLADDTVLAVREALAAPLVHAEGAPRVLIFALLGDCEQVYFALLRHSPVLRDKDLAAMVRHVDGVRQTAIAGRKRIGPLTASAVIAHAPRRVCARLLDNDGAEISRRDYETVLRKHGASSKISSLMLARHDLPAGIRAHLISVLSTRLSDFAVHKNWLDDADARRITAAARDKSLVRLAAQAGRDERATLIARLAERGKLTTSLLLQAACTGQLAFVAQALNCLSDVPMRRIQAVIRNRSATALDGICLRAGLAPDAVKLVQIALASYQGLARRGALDDEEIFGKRMIEQLVTGTGKLTALEKKRLLELIAGFTSGRTADLALKLAGELEVAA
jgi:uncharacterized protein (DUF2336 family)